MNDSEKIKNALEVIEKMMEIEESDYEKVLSVLLKS